MTKKCPKCKDGTMSRGSDKFAKGQYNIALRRERNEVERVALNSGLYCRNKLDNNIKLV
jgi:hypothetical protein